MLARIRQTLSNVWPWKRTSPNSISFNLNDPAAWDEYFDSGAISDAGVKVGPEHALALGAVWQCVSMISGDVARLPLDVFKRGDNDSREIDKNHPAWWLCRRQFNDEIPAFFGWRTLLCHLLLWNNAYSFIDRNGRGDPIGLYPMLPDRTQGERKNGRLMYSTEVGGKVFVADYTDVLHFRGITLDGFQGAELIKKAREAIGLGLAAQKFASRFFKHGVRSGGILELPIGMTAKAQEGLRKELTKHHEGEDNWFKTVILRDGAKFHQTSIPPNEGQMVETRDQQVKEVARYYNLAPSRLGLSDSVSYNSKYEDNKAYLDTTLAPWLEVITSELWLKLLSGGQRQADSHYFEHNTGTLLRMDTVSRFNVYAQGIRNGIFNPNECRQMENWPAREGGDEFVSLQSAPGAIVGGSLNGGADKQPVDGSSNKKGQREITITNAESDDIALEMEARTKRIVFGVTNHMRAKAKNPKVFCEFLDGNLVSHRNSALEELGNDFVIDKVLLRFKELAQIVTANQLVGAVDSLCRDIEREYL